MSPAIALATAAFAAGSITTVVYAVSCAALAPLTRVFIEKVQVGIGPSLFSTQRHGTVIDVRFVPILSSLTPFGASPFYGTEEGTPAPRPPPPNLPWREASPWGRILVFVVAPRLLPVALATPLLGVPRAGHAFVAGVAELVTGAVGPFSTARAILDAGVGVLGREGFITLVALALCKWQSLGLLALPTDVVFAAETKPGTGLAKLRVFVMLASFAVYVAWIVAWIGWAFR
ncbi:MAG: hypothetical protein QM820_30400 [Minicystis sp.]